MTTISLLFTLAFMLVVILISIWQRLGLERDLLIGTVRGAVQLLAIGYVLLWVFKAESWPATFAILAVMLATASLNAARRGTGLAGVTGRVLTALLLTEAITVGLMLLLHIVPPTPQYLISVSGMVLGNAMVNAGLLLNRLTAEVARQRGEIEVWLSLGATPRQATAAVLKAAVRAAMIPSVDALKTVGLVSLPGMMSGQILAGANPVEAVKYQLLILYALAAGAAICATLLGYLSIPLFFNRSARLVQ